MMTAYLFFKPNSLVLVHILQIHEHRVYLRIRGDRMVRCLSLFEFAQALCSAPLARIEGGKRV